MLAVENDYTFAGKLAEVYATQPRFAMQQGDILRVDLPEVIEQLRGMAPNGDGAGRRVKIVANLPYNITTEILKVLLSQGDDISHIAFMLQHEVAQRLSNPHPGAAPRTHPHPFGSALQRPARRADANGLLFLHAAKARAQDRACMQMEPHTVR